jgi:hypothetical protein
LRDEKLAFVDVKRDAQRRYNARLQPRLERSVWASGCSSWYRTKSGKNTTLWPGFTFDFWRRTRRFDRESYEIRSAADDKLAGGGPAWRRFGSAEL